MDSADYVAGTIILGWTITSDGISDLPNDVLAELIRDALTSAIKQSTHLIVNDGRTLGRRVHVSLEMPGDDEIEVDDGPFNGTLDEALASENDREPLTDITGCDV